VVAALDARDHDRALGLVLEAIAGAEPEERERLRELAVAIFDDLGPEDPLTVAYRRRLAAALY
jgi:thioredoxin-like negative regulator of GroEL